MKYIVGLSVCLFVCFFKKKETSLGFGQRQRWHETQRGISENDQAKDHDSVRKGWAKRKLKTNLSQHSSETKLEVSFYFRVFTYLSTFLHIFYRQDSTLPGVLRSHC